MVNPSADIRSADIVVIGAGLAGSAMAFHLAQAGANSVLVMDPDLDGEFSSSELNAGGVRGTWTTAVNIELSRRSIEFFGTHAEEFGYKPVGYMWLQRHETMDQALKARELHIQSGWPVEVLDIQQIQSRAPFIDKTSDLAGALFGSKDGLINPNALKNWYREEAKKRGVVFQNRAAFLEAKPVNNEWKISWAAIPEMGSDSKKAIFCDEKGLNWNGSPQVTRAKMIVNCAGAWAPQVAKKMGAFCPSFALRRQISLFNVRDLDLTPYGMIVDPSGVYFHPEATYGLAGFADPKEIPGYRLDYDGESFFQEHLWPALYERSSYFESLKHVTGWGGLYEVSPDHHAIIGRAKLDTKNTPPAFEAHSFSGHGVMQCHAAAESLVQLMFKDKMESETIPQLNVTRFLNAKAFASESWVI